jgi:hypothetical protein
LLFNHAESRRCVIVKIRQALFCRMVNLFHEYFC